jgi:hypothetical protein
MALDLECYFDGGNQADSERYTLVTLSVISGTPKQWRALEDDWVAKFTKHHIAFFHATEHKNHPDLMEDFAIIAHEHVFRKSPFRHGLYPFSVTIPLKDFVKARKENPKIPQNANDVLIREALYRCTEWGRRIGVRKYHMVFDQSEPFRGYVWDFKHNPKSKREYPILERFALTEDDMRDRPGLQMADLFAFSHSNRQTYHATVWHQIARSLEQDRVDFTYEKLLNPLNEPIEKSIRWKLPKRAPTK